MMVNCRFQLQLVWTISLSVLPNRIAGFLKTFAFIISMIRSANGVLTSFARLTLQPVTYQHVPAALAPRLNLASMLRISNTVLARRLQRYRAKSLLQVCFF